MRNNNKQAANSLPGNSQKRLACVCTYSGMFRNQWWNVLAYLLYSLQMLMASPQVTSKQDQESRKRTSYWKSKFKTPYVRCRRTIGAEEHAYRCLSLSGRASTTPLLSEMYTHRLELRTDWMRREHLPPLLSARESAGFSGNRRLVRRVGFRTLISSAAWQQVFAMHARGV